MTSKMSPEDIVNKIQAKVEEKNNESDDDNNECEEYQAEPSPTYSMAFECIEKR